MIPLPQWYECDLPLEDWCDAYNAQHPQPEVEAKNAATRAMLAASLARSAAAEAALDALVARQEAQTP